MDKRAPALSVSCLCHLLNAVLDDGLVVDSEALASSLTRAEVEASQQLKTSGPAECTQSQGVMDFMHQQAPDLVTVHV